MIGNELAFSIPEYRLVSPYELLYYTGLAAVGFTRLLYRLEDTFDAFPVSEYLKPAVGGLPVGGIGIFPPQVFGVGYETITDILLNRLDLGLLLALLIAKYLATGLTLGSGGSGGIFAPSLFLGATLGGAYGRLVHALFPGTTGQPGVYALVGWARL